MTQRTLFISIGLAGAVVGALTLASALYFINGTFSSWFDSKNEYYTGHTIVTGQRDETRIVGFLTALLDVAKKVSGDHTIGPVDIASITHGNVKTYVKGFHDHDRMEDIPIHDEQGTRDRSFDLYVEFLPNKVDALLKSLGKKPWLARRPKVLVLLRVQNSTGSYILNSDEDDERGAEQRAAFQDSAWQVGLPLVLPMPDTLAVSKLTPEDFDQVAPDQLSRLVSSNEADIGIIGHLIWVGGSMGWKADWSLQDEGGVHHWQIDDINFDGAFRNALRGAAQILSKHGEPAPNLN